MRGVVYANSAKGKENVGTRRIKIDCDVDDRLWPEAAALTRGQRVPVWGEPAVAATCSVWPPVTEIY